MPVIIFIIVSLKIVYIGDASWHDEECSRGYVEKDWTHVGDDPSHPPLYHALLKLWSLVFGTSLNAMEVFSIVPILLTMLAGALFLKREFSFRAALIFLVLLLANGPLYYYAAELRMYSLAFFFVTCNAIAAYYIITRDKPIFVSYFCLGLFSLFAAYTNYFSGSYCAILDGLVFLHLLIHNRTKIKSLVIVGIIAVLFFLPAFSHLLGSISANEGNIECRQRNAPLTVVISDGLNIASFFFGKAMLGIDNWFSRIGAIFSILLFGVAMYYFSRTFSKESGEKVGIEEKSAVRYFLCFLLVPITTIYFVGGIYAILKQDLIASGRHFLPSFGMLWLFFAIALSLSKRKRVIRYATAFLFSIAISISGPYSTVYEEKRNIGYELFKNTLKGRIEKGDVFFSSVSIGAMLSREFGITHGWFRFYEQHNSFLTTSELVECFKKCQENCNAPNAWILIQKHSDSYQRFKKIIPKVPAAHYNGNLVFEGDCELYHITPASRLKLWFEGEIKVLEENIAKGNK